MNVKNGSNGTNKNGVGVRKLTIEQVREIRKMWNETMLTQQEIANRFQVHQVTVSSIITGRTWAGKV